ncbi:hypothetical protein JCM8547_008661 [Rhodosporidiobolus lusitaniae]
MRPSPPSLLKLLALPLSRPSPSSSSSSTQPLFLLHALRSSLASQDAKDAQPPALKYVTKATDKAADLWSGLGKADGGWKKKAYDTGEKMMDKIEYEEWALKAIDPALAPKPWEAVKNGADGVAEMKRKKAEEVVELIFPPSLLEEKQLIETLKKQLEHREPLHRAAMRKCIYLSPLTWPFGILPVIPNFPLFYVLWRAWSHFRAYKASSYLLSLLTSHPSHLRPVPSSALDNVYSSSPSSSSSSQLLLTKETIPRLAKEFGMNDEETKELERAAGQTEERVRKGEEERHRQGETERVGEVVKEEVVKGEK